jgi:hypothetical protein
MNPVISYDLDSDSNIDFDLINKFDITTSLNENLQVKSNKNVTSNLTSNTNVTSNLTSNTNINYIPDGNLVIQITKTGAFINFSDLNPDPETNLKLVKKLENYFTLKHVTITNDIKKLKCCIVDKVKKRIIVPRFGIFEVLKLLNGKYTTKMKINEGLPPSMKFKWLGLINSNQKIIADYIMTNNFSKQRLEKGSAGVILNLEAGQGKSYLAAYLISIIGKKTLIVLHNTALIEQWVNVLKNTFGQNIKIGFYYSKQKSDGDIVIQIIDSSANDSFTLNKVDYTPIEYYNRFGFAIYDECHIYSNKTALKALKTAQTPYMLGLSATPNENVNGYDPAVWWSIGPVLNANELPNYESSSENFKAEIHRVMYYGSDLYTKLIINEFTGMYSVSSTVNMLCNDLARSMLVINCILESLKLNLFTFVFADRREYLTKLKCLLKITNNINGEICENDDEYIRIVGGSLSVDLEKAELKSKVIFTTYQYMGTGKSIIKMNGLVLATPRKSKMRQYINRIFRLGSDASITRHIWDICDMRLKLSTQWNNRVKYYKEKNYNIILEKYHYNDLESSAVKYESKLLEEIDKLKNDKIKAKDNPDKIKAKDKKVKDNPDKIKAKDKIKTKDNPDKIKAKDNPDKIKAKDKKAKDNPDKIKAKDKKAKDNPDKIKLNELNTKISKLKEQLNTNDTNDTNDTFKITKATKLNTTKLKATKTTKTTKLKKNNIEEPS